MVLAITRMISALYCLNAPTVAAVAGHALGGGFVLMLGCDVRLVAAGPEARFGLTEAAAGVPFPAGPLEVIRAELPAPVLRRLALTSETIDASELVALGLATAAGGEATLVENAVGRVRDLARQPAFGVIKQQIRATGALKLRELVRSGADAFLDAFGAEPGPAAQESLGAPRRRLLRRPVFSRVLRFRQPRRRRGNRLGADDYSWMA